MDDESKQEVAAIGMRTLATVKIVELIEHHKPGKIFTDKELEDACGKDVSPGGDGYGNLASAIRIVLRERGMVWERIRGADAIECKNPDGIAVMAKATNKRISRQAKRSVKQLNTVKIDDVPEGQRPAYRLLGAQLGTLAVLSSDSTRKKLEARKIVTPLDMRRLLTAFTDGQE